MIHDDLPNEALYVKLSLLIKKMNEMCNEAKVNGEQVNVLKEQTYYASYIVELLSRLDMLNADLEDVKIKLNEATESNMTLNEFLVSIDFKKVS